MNVLSLLSVLTLSIKKERSKMKNALKEINKFTGQRRMRSYRNNHFGGIEAAKLHPLGFVRFRPDEGGTVQTNIDISLAPVSGLMRSDAYVDVKQVFVPYQAIEKLELDTQDDAGVTEMTKRRLMAGEGIGLEDEGLISLSGNVHARTVSDANKVSKSVRLAYLCAVNHLRLAAYYNSTLEDKTQTAILPALLTANILDRMRGVIEPENLIDGAINLTGDLPVKGIGNPSNPPTSTNRTVNVVGTGTDDYEYAIGMGDLLADVNGGGRPKIFADLGDSAEISLRDMMQSKEMDRIIRKLAGVVKSDPVHGEEAVERALYGISCDFDDNCQVMFDRVYPLRSVHSRPTDGASFNEVSGQFSLTDSFGTIVPRSELGGQLVTLVSVKPLEVMAKQPDPSQTEPWVLENRIQDELELDEQLLTRQDLETGVAAANQDQAAFWVGHNSLKHNYATQGANDQNVFETEMRSSMWTYEVPTSVDETNVNYPDTIEMYPFYNWNGAHAEYTIDQIAMISTPLALGPNPVERIQLFKDDPSLIDV